jgi:glycogen synthase kinase 3 beta
VDFFYSVDTKERLIQNSVFEFCDMSLEQVIKALDTPPTSFMPMCDIKRYTKEILNGLHHMHGLRIVHRDLKPENILIKAGQVKICDFGSSKFIDESPSFKNTPYVVSRYYRAPELIFASNKYNEAIDIWAVGCILFELITRTPLFPGDTEGL